MRSRALVLLCAAPIVAAPLSLGRSAAEPTARAGGDLSAAPAIEIRGRVRDAAAGHPIGGAQVFLAGTLIGTLTDGAGRYSLELTDESAVGSELTITVRLVGYAETSRTVTVSGAATQTVDFELEQSALKLQDIVVSRRENDETRGPLPPAAESEAAFGLAGAALPRAASPYRDPELDTESYALIDENGWLTPGNHPLSTFSIDVDRASWANIRRFIHDGVRPPIDAVRIEEMVNYFPYDYPDVRGEHPFAIATDVVIAPWNEEHRLVRIGIQGRRVDPEDLPPSNLVFLLDVSGSMQSPDKLPLLKRSLRLLVNELRADDRVAIVVYAGAAGLVLESTPGSRRERILEAIERLEAGGSTAGGAGLRLAYRVAAESHIRGGNNRIILATDGDFNVGASSDAEMTRMIEQKREQGTFLTVLGFGTGNLKDSKMEAIADHGNGNYAYIDDLLEARKVLVTEMGGTLLTIARDVKIQVEFNPARVQAYRLIGYENRLLAAEDFNDDTKDAGELGAGHTVTSLYEIVPIGAPGVASHAVDPLRYTRPGGSQRDREEASSFGDASPELMFVKLRYKAPEGVRSRLIDHPVRDAVTRASGDVRFAASVAAFGMLLRDSEHCGDFGLADVIRLARGAVGADPHGYRSEFVRLVEMTRTLELLDTERE